jgi:hypothetical protein
MLRKENIQTPADESTLQDYFIDRFEPNYKEEKPAREPVLLSGD